MDHHLQAYFKSENDAESALVKLKRVAIRDARLDSIPEGNIHPYVIPALNFSSSATPNTGVVTQNTTFNDKGSSEGLTHILEFSVSPEDVSEALQVLSSTDAHVDEQSFTQFKS